MGGPHDDDSGESPKISTRTKVLIGIIITLVATSGWLGYVLATSSPTVNRVVTPGAIGPCTWFVSLDGTTPVAEAMVGGLSVSPGDNVVGTAGQDEGAFLNSITTADGQAFCFAPASYTFSSEWLITKNGIVAQGAGGDYGVLFTSTTGNNIIRISGSSGALNGIVIRQLRLQQNFATGTPGTYSLIYADGSVNAINQFVVEDTFEFGTSVIQGIRMQNVNSFRIDFNYFNTFNNPIVGRSITDGIISHNEIHQSADNEIDIASATRVSIDHNDIVDLSTPTSAHGTYVNGPASYITINYNTYVNSLLACIEIDTTAGNVNYVTIAGNTASNCGQTAGNGDDGIQLLGNDGGGTTLYKIFYFTITGNTVSGAKQNGIDIKNVGVTAITTEWNGIISNNVAFNNGQATGLPHYNRAGLNINWASNIVVSANTLFDNQTSKTQADGIFENAGQNQTYTGNNVQGDLTNAMVLSYALGVSATGNLGFNPQPVSSASAGPSVFTTTKQVYPQQIQLTTVNGLTSWTCNGITMSNTALTYSPVLLPGQTCAITWATTAPVFEYYPG